MNPTIIGTIFITGGVVYGSLIFDGIYNRSLGWMRKNAWVKGETVKEATKQNPLGRKPSILFYSLCLIIIGVYILWNGNI